MRACRCACSFVRARGLGPDRVVRQKPTHRVTPAFLSPNGNTAIFFRGVLRFHTVGEIFIVCRETEW